MQSNLELLLANSTRVVAIENAEDLLPFAYVAPQGGELGKVDVVGIVDGEELDHEADGLEVEVRLVIVHQDALQLPRAERVGVVSVDGVEERPEVGIAGRDRHGFW